MLCQTFPILQERRQRRAKVSNPSWRRLVLMLMLVLVLLMIGHGVARAHKCRGELQLKLVQVDCDAVWREVVSQTQRP